MDHALAPVQVCPGLQDWGPFLAQPLGLSITVSDTPTSRVGAALFQASPGLSTQQGVRTRGAAGSGE